MEVTEVERLAQEIASKTQEYIVVLRKHGCAMPSHDPLTSRNESIPPVGVDLQTNLMELTTELQALIQGPRLHVHNQVLAHVNLVNLHSLYKFKLPSLVPIGGSIGYRDLAQKAGVGQDVLRRIVRYAMTKHIFRETVDNKVAHSATSKMLVESPMMMEWIGMGYALAHNLETHLFDMLADQPERATRFANAMVYFNSNSALAPSHLCDAFDWTDVKQFVDIGGSTGATAVALAARFPELKIVIQDHQVLGEEARRSILPELKDRVTFMAHSFFDDQPIHDADAYHFRWIFHDWPDKYCVQLLRALIPALKRGARIIISDFVVPELGTTSPYQEGLVRGFDLAMMELFNSKERELKDWTRLFGEADSRFKFTGVRTVAGANLAFITAVWQGV
ncbi:hypothetical protein ACEQ8H_004740 [Pleosporales sp. CAS-2024a]